MRSEIVNIDEIEEIIIAYANGELTRRIEISDKRGDRDTIIAGINMLGEELEKTTVSRDYFMSIYNAVSETIIIADLEAKVTDCNVSAEDLLGTSTFQLKGNALDGIIVSKLGKLANTIKSFLSADESRVFFEATMLTKQSKEIPVSCTLSKLYDRAQNHEGYLLVAEDITERIEKERNNIKIAISTQENERKRLAYDIHDSLGQELNAIKMYLNSLALMERTSDEFSCVFEECKNIVNGSIETVRNISFDLMPKALEQGDLMSALNELVKRLTPIYKVEFKADEVNLQLSRENQINLYRVVQEFINNSIKHSSAKKIKVNISQQDGGVRISLKDNGIGFDLRSVKHGAGIYNMKARMIASNFKYNFSSELNKGTCLELFIQANDKEV